VRHKGFLGLEKEVQEVPLGDITSIEVQGPRGWLSPGVLRLILQGKKPVPEIRIPFSKDARQFEVLKGEVIWRTSPRILAYRHALRRAVQDGLIGTEEATALSALRRENSITDAEASRIAIDVFREVATEVGSDRKLTREEDNLLRDLQVSLGLRDETIESELRELARLRLLSEIQTGMLPMIPSPILLKKAEVCHHKEDAELWEDVTKSRYEGGYSGFSFRIMKGVRYHVGGSRGHRVGWQEFQATDRGQLIITNKRVVFVGGRKTIDTPYAKLLNIHVFEDGIQVNRASKRRREVLKVADPELTASIIATAGSNAAS